MADPTICHKAEQGVEKTWSIDHENCEEELEIAGGVRGANESASVILPPEIGAKLPAPTPCGV
jgi:hypothetical protein